MLATDFHVSDQKALQVGDRIFGQLLQMSGVYSVTHSTVGGTGPVGDSKVN